MRQDPNLKLAKRPGLTLIVKATPCSTLFSPQMIHCSLTNQHLLLNGCQRQMHLRLFDACCLLLQQDRREEH